LTHGFAPDVAISIEKNLLVDEVLLAKNFKYSFESKEAFGEDFQAKIKYAGVGAGAEIKFNLVNDHTLEAQIADGKEYLIAFKTISWGDLG